MNTNKIKKKKVLLQTSEEVSLEILAEYISRVVDHDDASIFVAMLEKNYESWDVTLDLARHFKKLEQEYLSECTYGEGEDPEDLSPKRLL